MKNIKYTLIQMKGSDRVTAILSNEREPDYDNSVLNTDSIFEAERMIDDKHYAYREEMDDWKKTLKKFKVQSKHKDYFLKIARMFFEKNKKNYPSTFEKAIKDGIEIKPIYIEVDSENKQFVVERKLTDIETLKEELYTGSVMSDTGIDIIIDKIKRKGYEIIKK